MAVKLESEGNTASSVVELKAAAFTLPIIRLLDIDMDAVTQYLDTKVDQAPEFFRNTPVVIDLSSLSPPADDIPFPLLVGLLRGYGMVPIGVRGGNAVQNQAAETMELAVMGEASARGLGPATAEPRPTPPPWTAQAAARQVPEKARRASGGATKLVTRPIRSGQRVYTSGGDLSIVGPVSTGAEIMADGNIHVYGPLRGRAMAGMNGDREARIFCQALEAELVSVAGRYRVSERIPEALKGAPVQVFLDHEVLRIEKF